MSLTSWIKGQTRNASEFNEILASVTPVKKDFRTVSGNNLKDYNMLVPYGLLNHANASTVGTAFDYLARFRIAHLRKDKTVTDDLVAEYGFNKLVKRNKAIKIEAYPDLLKPVKEYIDGSSIHTIESLIPVGWRLAKLESLIRGMVDWSFVKPNAILYGEPDPDVENELKGLLEVFEEKFMISQIINEKSNVIYNPHFGLASTLVQGADADILIDGTLYDFKTSKNKGFASADAKQLMGYYLLSEIAERLSDVFNDDVDYDGLEIKRLAIYKARYGEIESVDIANVNPEMKEKAVQRLAAFFAEGELSYVGLQHIMIDTNELKNALMFINTKAYQ